MKRFEFCNVCPEPGPSLARHAMAHNFKSDCHPRRDLQVRGTAWSHGPDTLALLPFSGNKGWTSVRPGSHGPISVTMAPEPRPSVGRSL